MDLALLGASLFLDVGAGPPGVVVPGIGYLTSGWGVVAVTRTRFIPVEHRGHESAGTTYDVAVRGDRATHCGHE